jgi:hypothetical protein
MEQLEQLAAATEMGTGDAWPEGEFVLSDRGAG